MPNNIATFQEHFAELRKRLFYVAIVFCLTLALGYFLSEQIYQFLLRPLASYYANEGKEGSIIYTSLAEAFFSYLKLAYYFAVFCTLPFLAIQIYLFASPALKKHEKAIFLPYIVLIPLLFIIGAFIAYHFIFPAAWKFFLSFESQDVGSIPVRLEARISEYLSLSVEIIIAFGLAFQLPIALTILNRFGLISLDGLKKKRRLAIVIIFIVAAIITPPDILSQIILATLMILLYEISILGCIFLNNKNKT